MILPHNHRIRGIILDMDGVLWRGDEPLGNLPEVFSRMRRAHLQIALATNNATRDVSQYLEKIAQFGVTLEPRQIVNSAAAAAFYLRERFAPGTPVYIVGEVGLVNTLVASGFSPAETDAQAVVAGMDRLLTYAKIDRAARLIRQGALFVGTNPDATFPTPAGLVPGAGSILAAIEVASGQKPVIAGKPSPFMLELAMKNLGTAATETLVVGDRLDTDIAGGQQVGCPTGLVLSGVTSPEDAKLWQPQPDYVAPDLTRLLDQILV